jgi:hypothetical protein
MATKKVKKGEEVQKIPVPIEWHISDNIITRFTTNMTVQIIENEFKISFFEIKPDIILGPSPVPREVRAECVGSVIVTADRLPKFIEVLQKQMDIYNSIRKEGN